MDYVVHIYLFVLPLLVCYSSFNIPLVTIYTLRVVVFIAVTFGHYHVIALIVVGSGFPIAPHTVHALGLPVHTFIRC